MLEEKLGQINESLQQILTVLSESKAKIQSNLKQAVEQMSDVSLPGEPKKAKSKAKVEKSKDEPKEEPKEATLDDLRGLTQNILAASENMETTRNELKALFAEFNATKLQEVKPEDYTQLYQQLQKLGG